MRRFQEQSWIAGFMLRGSDRHRPISSFSVSRGAMDRDDPLSGFHEKKPDSVCRIKAHSRELYWLATALSMLLCLTVIVGSSHAGASELALPGIRFNLDDPAAPKQISGILNTVLFLTVISLAPAILILTTSFTRLAVVLAFLKQALGTQGSPPSQVIVGLALFLTFFVMQPVWERIHQDAITPYQKHEISGEEFLNRGMKPLKDFMLKQTRKQDLALFASLAQHEKPKNADALPITTVIPAFVISELKTAFQIGFLLYLPFIILDMVVSSILLSMGMMMLPPVMISMPFKLMLFVIVDGWNLLITSLVKSFQ